MMAMESSMQAKGMTQTAESSDPGMVGCPAAARAAPGRTRAENRAVTRVRDKDQSFDIGHS